MLVDFKPTLLVATALIALAVATSSHAQSVEQQMIWTLEDYCLAADADMHQAIVTATEDGWHPLPDELKTDAAALPFVTIDVRFKLGAQILLLVAGRVDDTFEELGEDLEACGIVAPGDSAESLDAAVHAWIGAETYNQVVDADDDSDMTIYAYVKTDDGLQRIDRAMADDEAEALAATGRLRAIAVSTERSADDSFVMVALLKPTASR